MLANSRAALAALVCAALANSALGASIYSCSNDSKCSTKVPVVKDVKLGACSTLDGSSGTYKCTADSCTIFADSTCSLSAVSLPVNKPTSVTQNVTYLYEDLTGAIVGGIIGGLAFIALVATWRFKVTKTGPYAEGQTWVGFLTLKKPQPKSPFQQADETRAADAA